MEPFKGPFKGDERGEYLETFPPKPLLPTVVSVAKLDKRGTEPARVRSRSIPIFQNYYTCTNNTNYHTCSAPACSAGLSTFWVII